MFDFHADAVARVASEAAAQGNHRKATALYRSILQHNPLSDAAAGALNYLLINGGPSDSRLADEPEAPRAAHTTLNGATSPPG
jgi:hypothetical protein